MMRSSNCAKPATTLGRKLETRCNGLRSFPRPHVGQRAARKRQRFHSQREIGGESSSSQSTHSTREHSQNPMGSRSQSTQNVIPRVNLLDQILPLKVRLYFRQ